MTVMDKRGKEYELEINEDGTVNIFFRRRSELQYWGFWKRIMDAKKWRLWISSWCWWVGWVVGRSIIKWQRSKVMSDVQLDKKTYIGIVRFTLQSMVELAAENKEYNLLADTLYYYEKTIKPENILNKDEFLELCKEAGIK